MTSFQCPRCGMFLRSTKAYCRGPEIVAVHGWCKRCGETREPREWDYDDFFWLDQTDWKENLPSHISKRLNRQVSRVVKVG